MVRVVMIMMMKGTHGYKNDGGDDDGCLNSVKNCFTNKQIVLESFSLPGSARWENFYNISFRLM